MRTKWPLGSGPVAHASSSYLHLDTYRDLGNQQTPRSCFQLLLLRTDEVEGRWTQLGDWQPQTVLWDLVGLLVPLDPIRPFLRAAAFKIVLASLQHVLQSPGSLSMQIPGLYPGPIEPDSVFRSFAGELMEVICLR